MTRPWYEPGEPHRPRGFVDRPTQEDMDLLDDADVGDQVLVQWLTGPWRCWEKREELRHDVPAVK